MEDQVQDVVAGETTNDNAVNENVTDVLEPFSPDFNPETGQYAGNERVATEQPVAEQGAEPQEQRYEYWQSKYDQKGVSTTEWKKR